MICSFLTTGIALGMSLGLHPVLKTNLSSGVVLLIDQGVVAGLGAVIWFFLVPALNDVFIGGGLEYVDPNAIDASGNTGNADDAT